MATPTELSVLLRIYTGKQKSPTVIIQDFCDYLQKYARHYLQQVPELAMYLNDTPSVVQKELERLEADRRVELSSDSKGRRVVFVPQFFIDRMTQRYRNIDEHPEIPYPLSSELPQGFPSASFRQVHITTDFAGMQETDNRSGAILNQLVFPDETPPLLYPGIISPEKMLDFALSKIRFFLFSTSSTTEVASGPSALNISCVAAYVSVWNTTFDA